ncbi:hypothetical protein [uncultured Aquimarina sp.]|uniref:hypothetical protein n=1 Tax=uncultured Aquimarina sp. TaxID=575652 RepID=UPI002617B0CB|nr:hypothetical protein [uncultured Aquimarina sp.]
MKKQLIYGCFGSIFTGSLIYILFRSNTLKMFDWFNQIGFINLIEVFREYIFKFSYLIPDWILFSLPDGLWLFSYVSTILYIWNNDITKNSLLWIFIVPTIAILSEICQAMKILPGTFDLNDLLFYLLGIYTPFILYKSNINFKIYPS